MNAQDLNEVRKGLEERREMLKKRIERIQASKKRDTPLSADFEEQAVEMENNEVIDALDDMELEELAKINRAIASIDQGSYGVCESCGADIKAARLKAMPYSVLCIECASNQ